MSLSDIKLQLHELYGAEVSKSLISRITDYIMDEVKAWQNRPLESVYPIVFFDCLVVKVRQDKRIINKSIVSYKDRKKLAADLKPIYTAKTEDDGLLALESFEKKWDRQHPQIAKSWYYNWSNLVIFSNIQRKSAGLFIPLML